MARVLLSQSESEALGLIRMLNNSSASSGEYLADNGLEISEAAEILKNITPLNYNNAKEKRESIIRNSARNYVVQKWLNSFTQETFNKFLETIDHKMI